MLTSILEISSTGNENFKYVREIFRQTVFVVQKSTNQTKSSTYLDKLPFGYHISKSNCMGKFTKLTTNTLSGQGRFC